MFRAVLPSRRSESIRCGDDPLTVRADTDPHFWRRLRCAHPFHTAPRARIRLRRGFRGVPHLSDIGWSWSNNSVPLGDTDWYQGNPAIFPAWAGGPGSYVAADSNNAGAGNTSVVSNG